MYYPIEKIEPSNRDVFFSDFIDTGYPVPVQRHLTRSGARWLISLALALGLGNDSRSQAGAEPGSAAHFQITDTVINPEVGAFAANIGGFGNSLFRSGSGFEPVVFRDRYLAQEDAPDRIVASPMAISHWDTLRDGALDGADVFVYRIERGRLDLVRQDRVTQGGFAASGWLPLLPDGQLVDPAEHRFRFRWDAYNRPGVPYWFTVRAIDRQGGLSPHAKPVTVLRPEHVGAGAVTNKLAPAPRRSPPGGSAGLPAPTGFRATLGADGVLTLDWSPVPGDDVAGYAVYRADAAPETQQGFHLRLSQAPTDPKLHIRAGDLALVSKKFYSTSRTRLHSNRVWGADGENRIFMPGLVEFFPDEDPRRTWALVAHEAGTPVLEPGETFLRLQLDPGVTQPIGTYNHSGSGQDWYDVLEPRPYRVEVWLRQHGPGTVRFRLTGHYASGPNPVPAIEFRPDEKWRQFSATFTPPAVQAGDRPNQMLLEFSGPGRFDVDNFRVYRADTPFLDYSSDEYDELRRSGMSALRTHGLVKTGRATYDLEQLTNPGGVIAGKVRLNTLPQTLSMLRRAGVRPWLQIEPHLSPAEWLGLVEYLAAPYDPAADNPRDKPWAHKRFTQGQSKPWTDEFPAIDLELGNETWNRLMRPWTFNEMTDAATGQPYSAGQVYGLYQEHVARILRSSPYWRQADLERKLGLVLGGWNGLPYGREAAAASPSSGALLIGCYNGGWDEGEGAPDASAASYFAVLNQVSQSAAPTTRRHQAELAVINARRTTPMRLGCYEAGPGYALNGLNGARVTPAQAAQQERVMKSLAAGTATLDAFLARAALGMTTQSFFTFNAGSRWSSHAKWYRGGQAYPSWQLLALFNREAAGTDMLAVKTLSVPSASLPASGRRPAVKRAPLVAAYAFRGRDRFGVFLVSRKMPGYPDHTDAGYTPVTLDLPFRSAGRVTLHRAGGDPAAHNVDAGQVRIETLPLPGKGFGPVIQIDAGMGSDARGLPPAAALLYVFEDVRW